MEALLSFAFDNLSSYDSGKIRRGLRQIEGLLAQLCLSPKPHPASSPPKRTRGGGGSESDGTVSGSDSDGGGGLQAKSLAQLSGDPAFREFFKLQEGFEWNVALRLVGTLDRLLARSDDGENELVIVGGLNLMQGLVLLHPPSKSLFVREQHMNLLLDLLEPAHCPAIQSAALLTLVSALIDAPANTRTFEALDGLLTITSLFRSRSTPRDVKLKLVEFLYFYLMPETPQAAGAARRGSIDGGGTAARKRDARAAAAENEDEVDTRTTEEKQAILGRHLPNVKDLVKDLTTSTPFGGARNALGGGRV